MNELAFHFIYTFYEHIEGLAKEGILQKAYENSYAITISERQYLIRMLNSLIANALTLIFSSDFIRTDAVGTHLVENSIGVARQTSNDPRWERILTSFSHSEIRKSIANKYSIKLHVQNRLNDGGCKINQTADATDDDLLSKPENWSVTGILQLFLGLCDPETADALKPDLISFMSDIADIGPLIKINHYNVNETANSSIIARLISFKGEDDSCESDDDE